MRFERLNKTIILFIAISIAIHLCLLAILWLEGSFGLPHTNPFRIKIALESSAGQKIAEQNLRDKIATEKSAQIAKTNNLTPLDSESLEKPESSMQRTGGWGATKGPANKNADLVSERSALQSRIHMERQQRLNAVSGNIAQLLGRLNQESFTVGCALWVNQSANKGYLKCNPENLTEQIKFYLAPANIEWVNQSDLQPPAMCIPIQIRDAHAVC